MLFDHEFWKRREGHRIGERITLERFVSSDNKSATFETLYRDRPATIRLFPGTPEEVAARRRNWREAAGLSHPALVEVLSRGETVVDETPCAYIVTERPDRNGEENPPREALGPLLGAVRYLHEHGFAHGELKAGCMVRIDGQWKLSSDTLTHGGDTNADCVAIGELVKLGDLTPPYSHIVKGAEEGWSAAQMEAALLGKRSVSRKMWVGAAAAVLVGGGLFFRPAPAPEPPAPVVAEPKQEAPPISKPSPVSPPPAAAPKPKAEPPPKPAAAPKPEPPKPVATVNTDGIAKVMPDIPASARRTIRGRVRVNVRVQVDADGRVTQAAIAPPAASAYFTPRVLTAARGWKFPPAAAPSEWMLLFELMRVDTRVSVAKAR